MEKNLTIFLTLICLVFLTNSCQKDSSSSISDKSDIISLARSWHEEKLTVLRFEKHQKSQASGVSSQPTSNFLKPQWEKARSAVLSNGASVVVVPAEGYQLENSQYFLIRQLVFLTNGQKIKS